MKKKKNFPDPRLTTEEGLLAIGGDLSPGMLLEAYYSGIFPWFKEQGLIHWFCPPQRMVLFPSKVKVSASMKQVMRPRKFHCTFNEAFEQVITTCAQWHSARSGSTWIDADFISAYTVLHRLGHARSVEVWQQEKLVGGLYGITVGKIFCGESMFSRVSNASKAALIHLCRAGGYELIDCQIPTVHLASMGAEVISRSRFLGLLMEFSGKSNEREE
jgi:leucyl/phenylalanyl-tRNA--protein transferase